MWMCDLVSVSVTDDDVKNEKILTASQDPLANKLKANTHRFSMQMHKSHRKLSAKQNEAKTGNEKPKN